MKNSSQHDHLPQPLNGSASQGQGKDVAPDSEDTVGGARSDVGKAVFISPFDQPIFCTPAFNHNEFNDAEKQVADEPLDPEDFDHIVTIDDLESVNPLAGMVDSSAAPYSWELVANANAAYGPAFDPFNITGDLRVWQLSKLVCGFIKNCDAEVIDHLVQKHDRDTTLGILGDRLLDWFADKIDSCIDVTHFAGTFTKERAFFAALELLALGVQHFHEPVDKSLCGFPMHQVIQVYDAAQEQVQAAKKIREDRLIDLSHAVYWDHRIDFLSPTDEQEGDIDLAPAHKARIFMNAVKERYYSGTLITTNQRNASGTLVAIGINYRRLIIFRHEDVYTVEAVFERYQLTSAKDLLIILDRCLQVHVESVYYRDRDKHEAFHAEKGRRVIFFVTHLKTITKELKKRYSADFPGLLRR